MPGLTEPAQVGTRQDLSAYITNIERTETPLFTELPKGSINKTTFEDQVDDYGDTDDIDGVRSDADADSFRNEVENRGLVSNQCMKMWENPKVDDFSENVNENPALAQGEYTESVRKALVRLKLRGEKLLLSRVEASRQEGGRKYRTCSIGGFVNDAAPVGTQTVSARFRTMPGAIYRGTLDGYDEDRARAILKEIFEATNGKGRFKHYCGSDLKEAYTLMSIYRPDRVGSTTIQHINHAASRTLQNTVDILIGDFGTIELIPTTRMRYFDADGMGKVPTSQTQRRGSGLILDMKMWALAFKRQPGHKKLEDKGGGPRGICDMIFGLRCKNPRGNGAVYVTDPQ
jgi:hypothetical protein